MDVNQHDTAVVFIDPQNDVLSETGLAWGVVGRSVRDNHTVENMERVFRAAKRDGFEVFICRTTSIRRTMAGSFGGRWSPTSMKPGCSPVVGR